jgi:hypothetical protein
MVRSDKSAQTPVVVFARPLEIEAAADALKSAAVLSAMPVVADAVVELPPQWVHNANPKNNTNHTIFIG